MHIQFSEVPAINKKLEEAILDQEHFVGVDQSIALLTRTDLYFFKSQEQAIVFQEFNAFHYKNIALSTASDLLMLIKDVSRNELRNNANAKSFELPVYLLDSMMAANDLMRLSDLKQLLDGYNWKAVSYEPNTTVFASHEEKVHYNRLEWLVEQFSALAQSDNVRDAVRDTLARMWEEGPMQKHIDPVLQGAYGEKAQFIIQHKIKIMNEENLEYLRKQMLYSGFGEGLNTQLERKLKEGHPDFQLNASHEFGKDKMDGVLYFSRSKQEGSDKYFFNKYDASLNNTHGEFSQTFFINNKGQSITFKEACNLLNGRSVYKELTPKEGTRYKAWVKLDFNNRDEHGNAKLNIFNEKYGFSLKESLGRIPLQELKDPERMATLFATLEGGNMAKATLIKSDREMEVQLAADPKFKTVKMFDMEGVKLYVPAPKMEKQYGQALADEKRADQGQAREVGQPLSDAKQQNRSTSQNKKDRPLLEKKNQNQEKGQRIR
ncbi:MAG: hypothetical protein V4450_17735 [Bacteroidota bacterium]